MSTGPDDVIRARDIAPPPWRPPGVSAVLALADGAIFEGIGLGATGVTTGEVCFNTAMTGYQEILTDLSYAGQLVTFTFPHIGNVGVNGQDVEMTAKRRGARGCILRNPVTAPSNYRADGDFSSWLKARGIIGIAGIDTRALTTHIRRNGMVHAALAHAPDSAPDADDLIARARGWEGIQGADLTGEVTSGGLGRWTQTGWRWASGAGEFGRQQRARAHVVAIDYGLKSTILRCLAEVGCRVTVVAARTPAQDILRLEPDGVFLSNGPGDPAATAAAYAREQLRALIAAGKPVFGICLGHQLLALALGARTTKMHQGHHGANHPVKNLQTGQVEITSMNHGFSVDRASLPEGVEETHVSLFDDSNCGLRVKDKPVFSVQYHPEASPGPQDSRYLFTRFFEMMTKAG